MITTVPYLAWAGTPGITRPVGAQKNTTFNFASDLDFQKAWEKK
jgi:hypothetical protein